MAGKGGLGKSVLAPQHDDDDCEWVSKCTQGRLIGR